MCVCVCVCVRERERDPNIKVIQYVCRLSNLKQSISVYTRYPETKTVNQCVCRLSKYKRVSWVYRLSRYKTISMCVCVCVWGGGFTPNLQYPLTPASFNLEIQVFWDVTPCRLENNEVQKTVLKIKTI